MGRSSLAPLTPSLEWGEFSWQTNNYFDAEGGYTLDKIDLDYFVELAGS